MVLRESSTFLERVGVVAICGCYSNWEQHQQIDRDLSPQKEPFLVPIQGAIP